METLNDDIQRRTAWPPPDGYRIAVLPEDGDHKADLVTDTVQLMIVDPTMDGRLLQRVPRLDASTESTEPVQA